MSGLPDVLKIPDGPEKLSIPAGDLPVSALIKLKLPPQRASSIYTHPTDYLSELAPTITTFNTAEIVEQSGEGCKGWGRYAEDAEAEIVVAEDGVETGKRKRRANPNSPGDGLEHIHVFPTLNSHSIHTQSAVRDEDWYSDLSGKVPGGQMGAAQMCSATNGDPGQAYSRGSATIWRLDPKLLSVNTEESW
ncbi:hypothetical protein DFH09DRAFT_1068612 [Mycena vulgaris]|nr:hypothetical protein DFH09DRAFT_1068612 [Mycena vulgaris]